MNAIAFDTHAHVKRLVGAGMTEDQAEAVIEAVKDTTSLPDISQLPTKTDLQVAVADLRAEIQAMRADTKAEFSSTHTDRQAEFLSVRADLKAEVVSIRADLKAEILSVRADMKGLRGELIWWIIGTGVVSTVAHYFIK